MTPHLTLMAIYILAFGIGLAQAFGIPSGTAIMPLAIAPEQLQAANGMLMGLRQLSMLIGPLIAAGLLAIGGDGHVQGHAAGAMVADARGLALAFGLDCLSFLVSAWTLSKVRLLDAPPSAQAPAPVLRAVGAGLAMVWRDVPLRTCFIYWGAVSLLIGGAMQVGLPVLAAALHGATTLGLLMGVHGAGTLLGMGAAAMGGARLRFATFGTLMLLIDGAVAMIPLSQLFVGGGMILVLCAALAYVFTPMRRITSNPY